MNLRKRNKQKYMNLSLLNNEKISIELADWEHSTDWAYTSVNPKQDITLIYTTFGLMLFLYNIIKMTKYTTWLKNKILPPLWNNHMSINQGQSYPLISTLK